MALLQFLNSINISYYIINICIQHMQQDVGLVQNGMENLLLYIKAI